MGKTTHRVASAKALKSILKPSIIKAKSLTASYTPNIRRPNQKNEIYLDQFDQASSKKFVELIDIIKLLSLRTGIDLQSYEASLPHTIAV